MVFGRLTAINRAGSSGKGNIAWACVCECGNKTVVNGQKLREGRTKSCGCYSSDVAKTRFTKHGESRTRLFRVWGGMLNRCSNPNNVGWENYGGRGITVDTAWGDSYEAFRDWAVANGYTDELSIDRIDNDGNYGPDNCRWTTMEVQSKNKRNNVRLNDGRLAYEVSEVSQAQLRKRIHSHGMSLEDAALTPSRRPRTIMPDGSFAVDTAKANGIPPGTFSQRIRFGWDVVRAATEQPRKIRNHHHAQP